MFARGTIMARRFVQDGTVEQPVKTLLLAAGVALLLVGAGNATANVIIQDFFGSTNDLGDGTLTRHDDAGNTVLMGSGQQGPTLIGLDGLRSQFPDTSAEVWRAPGGQHVATWFFASASTDPFETVTPGDVNNLVAVAGADAGVLWATRRHYRDDPRWAGQISELLEELYGEFGWRSRLAAPVVGRYLYRALRKQNEMLSNDWTYEPPTFYETNHPGGPHDAGRIRSVRARGRTAGEKSATTLIRETTR